MADLVSPKRQPAIGRRLFVLASTVVWLTVLAFVFENSIDRLSVPSWGNPVGDSLSAEMAGTPHVGQHSPTAILDGATSYLNGRTVAGTLQFCTFFALKTRDRVDYLLTRLAGGRPYVLGSKGGYIGLVAAYILVLCLLLWQAAKAVLREE